MDKKLTTLDKRDKLRPPESDEVMSLSKSNHTLFTVEKIKEGDDEF